MDSKIETPTINFRSFPLSEPLQLELEKCGFVTPTPIQQIAIPQALRARDLVARAPTGTGKTLAFALPSIERLSRASEEGRRGVRIVVLAPTRELAMQIKDVMERFGRTGSLTTCLLVGGLPLRADITALRRSPNIIIATPGRLIDHVRQRTISLGRTAILVFDEADRMLDLGFLPQIVSILREIPKERQTLLFSATIPAEIEALVAKHTNNPVRLEIGAATATAAGIEQQAIFVTLEHKTQALIELLKAEEGTTLVFVSTKANADWLYQKVKATELPVAVLHGDLSQSSRIKALEAFQAEHARILIATDVAGRGLDVEGIAHVINYDVPQDANDYIHRIGRTARAEATGRATLLVAFDELELMYNIERHLKKSIPRGVLPAAIPTPPWTGSVKSFSAEALSHAGVFAPQGIRISRRR
ncbi:MAG: DEAD/DEAH box helicase [Planctomycetota bacterium]